MVLVVQRLLPINSKVGAFPEMVDRCEPKSMEDWSKPRAGLRWTHDGIGNDWGMFIK